MIDLIIPSYNDLNGLRATLISMGNYADVADFTITIVDDASTNITQEDYNNLLADFSYFSSISVLYLPENKGPGYARQYGIDHTTEPYLIFMDCGDVFKDQLTIFRYIDLISHEPQIEVMVPNYLYETAPNRFSPKPDNSEFHGTFFKREFLTYHNLRIPTTFSYSHEDTPFIAMCCIISQNEHKFKRDEVQYTIRTYNENSLTNKQQREFYYKYCCEGYITNAQELLQQVQNINDELFRFLVYYYITSAYSIYLQLIETEYEQYFTNAINAMRKFYLAYTEYFIDQQKFDRSAFLYAHYDAITAILVNHELIQYHIFDIKTFLQEINPLTLTNL